MALSVLNQVSPSLGFDYDSFIYNLKAESFYRNNCTKTYSADGITIEQSSPFIAALAARILLCLKPHPMKSAILNNIIEYLCTKIDKTGMIGFLDPNHHRHDLDTIASVHGLIYELNPICNRAMIPGIIDIFERHRDQKSGAFYTWIDKPNNNIDFIVNMNIGLFFDIIDHCDSRLMEYLINNYENFLSNGSHYYHNIGFPLFMSSVYNKHLENISHHDAYLRFVNEFQSLAEVKNELGRWISKLSSNIAGSYQTQHFHNIECFNSRDGIYHSRIIAILCRALVFTRSS